MIRIAILAEDAYRQRFSYLDAAPDLMAAAGIALVADHRDCDLLIIQDQMLFAMEKEGERLPDAIAVYERTDAATLNRKASFRQLLRRPNIRLWLKQTAFRDWRLNNEPVVNGRHHVMNLARAAGIAEDERLPEIVIDPADAAKIVTLPLIHGQPLVASWRECDPPPYSARHIDVGFAGNVDYSVPWLTQHRRRACTALAAIENRAILIGMGRVLPANDFNNALQSCRVFLSPYGYGEYSWKDYQAIFAGCVVIKPPISHVVTGGFDIYAKGRYCTEVDYWFGDLDEKLDSVFANIEHIERQASVARAELMQASEPAALVNHFAGVVRQALFREGGAARV